MGERAKAAVLAAIGALMGAQAADAATKKPTGNGVKDRTLTLKDFKHGVLESKFYTEREVRSLLLKLENTLSSKIVEHKVDLSPFARIADLTASLGDLSYKIDTLHKLTDERAFKQQAVDGVQDLKIAANDGVDAQQAQKILKLEAAVQRFGDGSVHTGRALQQTDQPAKPVVTVPGAVAAFAEPAGLERGPLLRLTELSGADATVVGTRNGVAVGPLVLKGGASDFLSLAGSPTTFVLQVLSADGGLTTLTITVFGDGSVRTWSGQALAAG